MDILLEARGIVAGYGDVRVLRGADIVVQRGEIVCLIGSNGAGKTTFLRVLSGMVHADAGTITLADKRLVDGTPQAFVQAGIAHVPEGRRLFAGMTVRENLFMGAYLRRDGSTRMNRDLDFVLATFPRLEERLNQDASTLSGGEQQMCAIGRGIMAGPSLLMIDELSLGLAPKLVSELGQALRTTNSQGMSILLVEQDVATALQLARHGFVLDTGEVVLSGTTNDLAGNPAISTAYLGAA